MSTYSLDVTTATFEREVLEASQTAPVVVDFWAPWCSPCKVLKPILERLAAEYQGRFILAKVNTDDSPEVAARFGIRGIPRVAAFLGGAVIADFTGAVPESAARSFIERIIPAPAEELRLKAVRSRRAGELNEAAVSLREAIRLDPENQAARVDLVETLIGLQAWDEAQLQLSAIPERERGERAEKLAVQIDWWKKGVALPDAQQLRDALRDSPGDPELRLRLADRLVIDGKLDEALDHLIEIVRVDRGPLRERARKTVLDVFDLAKERVDLVAEYRRRLASALY